MATTDNGHGREGPEATERATAGRTRCARLFYIFYSIYWHISNLQVNPSSPEHEKHTEWRVFRVLEEGLPIPPLKPNTKTRPFMFPLLQNTKNTQNRVFCVLEEGYPSNTKIEPMRARFLCSGAPSPLPWSPTRKRTSGASLAAPPAPSAAGHVKRAHMHVFRVRQPLLHSKTRTCLVWACSHVGLPPSLPCSLLTPPTSPQHPSPPPTPHANSTNASVWTCFWCRHASRPYPPSTWSPKKRLHARFWCSAPLYPRPRTRKHCVCFCARRLPVHLTTLYCNTPNTINAPETARLWCFITFSL